MKKILFWPYQLYVWLIFVPVAAVITLVCGFLTALFAPLVNPEFATYARAFGAYGEKVERTEDFAAAFERAVVSGKPAVLELAIDPECICINMPKLSQLDKG